MICSKELTRMIDEMTKKEICDGSLRILPFVCEERGYRYTDIFNYVCDYLDLDNRFDEIINKMIHEDNVKYAVANEIINEVEEKVKEGIF